MISKFDTFVNEKYTLTIEDSMDDFEGAEDEEIQWPENIDVSDLWTQYREKKFSQDQFLTNYNKRLLEKKDNLIKLGTDCWNDLIKSVNKKEKDFHNYLNEVYDWADKYGIKIISKKK